MLGSARSPRCGLPDGGLPNRPDVSDRRFAAPLLTHDQPPRRGPLHLGHGDGGEPRQLGHDAATARRQETRGGATARSCCGCDVGERAALQHHREHARALPQQAGGARRQPDPLIRSDPPSQPNYLALFSGSTQGVTSNACPQQFPKADNLGHQLRTAGLSFAGYAESLSKVGFTGCASGGYQRKHNPWVNFTNLPASVNRPFGLPARLSQAADRVVREPEHVPQHARLLDPHR